MESYRPARMQTLGAPCALLAAATMLCGFGSAMAADAAPSAGSPPAVLKDPPAIINGTIGYVMTHKYWAVHQTPDAKAECPEGFNDGPREQFKALFPEDGQKRALVDTHLKREGQQWFPATSEDPFPFKEVKGKVSVGLNLDGKVDANDFESPTGEKGIDNQFYRAIGCVANYRAPEGTAYHFENEYMRRYNDNRILIELTGVDSLANDNNVTVTTYRGLDPLLTDATGNAFVPGGSQRVDMRWGKRFVYKFQGKIVDGVLMTEPGDLVYPAGITFETSSLQFIRGLRFNLKLTPDGAEGLMAGYVDIETFNHHLNTGWSTHHQSYGQESAPSIYRAMNRLADGYPDPKTGANTAISSALTVKFTQVFIQHPPKESASKDSEPQRVAK